MLCGFFSSTAPTAIAEDGRVLHAASSNRDLWIAKPLPDSETLIILHRRAGDEPNQVRIVSSGFRGPLAPGGFTAGQDRLWLIHAERPIYSVRPPPTAADAMWQPRHPSIAGNLPRQVELRVSGAGPRRLWTLVRVSDAAGLDSIAALEGGAVMESRRSVATNPAPVTGATPTSTDEPEPVPADVESTPADAETLASAQSLPPLSQDRLLRLHGNRWINIPLPLDWPHGAPAWIKFEGDHPRLLAITRTDDTQELHLFRNAEDVWTRTSFPLTETGPLLPLLVESQLVLGLPSTSPGQLDLALRLIQPDITLGSLSLASPEHAWSLVSFEQRASLVALGSDDTLLWTRMDLRENVVPATPLTQIEPSVLKNAYDLVWVGTLAFATLIMFVFIRRDPEATMLHLPRGMLLADFGRRLAAGVVDLTPCIIIAGLAFPTRLDRIYAQNLEHTDGWANMAPAGLMIGLLVIHTVVSEVFTARTMGKALFGLQVTDLKGRPPNVWQVLVRNLSKILDLIVPPLLILILAGPNRQRLGDLVGRTVVVMRDPQWSVDRQDGKDTRKDNDETSRS